MLDIYLLRLSSVDIDLYIADNSQFAGMEVASQKLKVIQSRIRERDCRPYDALPGIEPARNADEERKKRAN